MLIAIEGVLTKAEAASVRARLSDADWTSGSATAGTLGRNRKSNDQLDDETPLAIELGAFVRRRLESHPLFFSAALPRKLHPPRFNRYGIGGAYGAHVDSALMRLPREDGRLRSDLSATLFLNEPEDYDGGALEIEGAFGVQAAKLPAGDVVLYPSSSLHRVTPVTRGERLVSILWIESHVQDDGARTLLFDLDQAIQGFTRRTGSEDDDVLKLAGVYHNLLRRWAST